MGWEKTLACVFKPSLEEATLRRLIRETFSRPLGTGPERLRCSERANIRALTPEPSALAFSCLPRCVTSHPRNAPRWRCNQQNSSDCSRSAPLRGKSKTGWEHVNLATWA